MVNQSYTACNAVYTAIVDKLAAASLTPKLVGENFTLAPDSPVVLVVMTSATRKRLDMESTFEVTERISLIVLIRETLPAHWQDEILKVVCKVEDVILADPTLNGAAQFAYPISRRTEPMVYGNKTFFGGEVVMEALYYFSP